MAMNIEIADITDENTNENRKNNNEQHFKVISTGEGKTKAMVESCSNDAFKRVAKRLGLFTPNQRRLASLIYDYREELEMANKYSATVTCHEPDAFDAAKGESEAVHKAMMNHNRGFKLAIKRWMKAILKDLKEVEPDLFNEVINEVR